jgi:hypothetical protein
MGEVIHLFKGPKPGEQDIITARPLEFRKTRWESACFIQIRRTQTLLLEKSLYAGQENGPWRPTSLPPHVELSGGLFNTIAALFSHREDEATMREVYYLTGLMDCMINQVNPVLRTDLLRDMYRRIFKMREELKVGWYARPLDRVLLPIDPSLYDEGLYRKNITEAGTLKDLYAVIRKGTSEMFEVLSEHYSFYCPSPGPFQRGKV